MNKTSQYKIKQDFLNEWPNESLKTMPYINKNDIK